MSLDEYRVGRSQWEQLASLLCITFCSQSFGNSPLTPIKSSLLGLSFRVLCNHTVTSLWGLSPPHHTLNLLWSNCLFFVVHMFLHEVAFFLFFSFEILLSLSVPLQSYFLQTDLFLSPPPQVTTSSSSEHWQLCLHYFLCTYHMLLGLLVAYIHLS